MPPASPRAPTPHGCKTDAPPRHNLPAASHHPGPRGRAQPTCRDVTHGKQAHTRVPVHRPLEGLAVGLAAVVHEPGVVAFGAGVDDAVLQAQPGQARARARAGRLGGPARDSRAVALATVVSCVYSDRSPQSSPVAVAPGGRSGPRGGTSPGNPAGAEAGALSGGHRRSAPTAPGAECSQHYQRARDASTAPSGGKTPARSSRP